MSSTKATWDKYLNKKSEPADPLNPQSKGVKNNEDLYSCALAGAFSVTNQVRDAATLMHSPPGCAHASLAGNSLNALSQGTKGSPAESVPHLFCTNMGEKEMVFGGEARLIKSLKSLADQKPSAIFVITSCPSAIIGDDPRSALSKLRESSGSPVPIVPIDSSGVFEGDYSQGILNAYRNIAENFADPSVRPQKGWVNIVAEPPVSNSSRNFSFFREMIEEFGLKLNCRFIYRARLEEVRNFKKAEINLLASSDANANLIQSYLEKKLDAKFFPEPAPAGWERACDWLRRLSTQLLGATERAEKMIEKNLQSYEPRRLRLRKKLSGKRAMVFAYENQWEWLWKLLETLEVEVAESTFYPSAVQEPAQKDKKREGAENRLELIGKCKPDLVLSNYAFRNLPQGTIAGILPLYPSPGFFGDLEVAERWAESGKACSREGWLDDLAV